MTATLETLREQMRSCLEAGNLEKAADACLRGLRQYPRWVEGHRFLGEVNLSQDSLDAARRCFELVAAAEPDNATPYVGIGVVLEHQQRFAEAVIAFERALDLDQTDNEVRQELVRLYAQVGNTVGVQTTRAALAHQHVRGHMLRQAEREIDNLLVADPKRLDLMLARARVAWLNGNADAAERSARAVLELSPDCVMANLIAGESLARVGRQNDAAPFLTAVRELDPEAELTSSALQGVLAEGVSIAPGLPVARQDAPVDDSVADAASTHEDSESPIEVPRSDQPATPAADDSPAPADAEPWMSTPLELNIHRAAPAETGRAGMLDSLLKDLDQVWPERLDLGQTSSSKQTAAAAATSAALPEVGPADDEDLPPSFLGDVSEIIREFEDPADHYDLFSDLPAKPAIGATAAPSSATGQHGPARDAEPFDFAAELAVSHATALAPVEEPTLSGQHAIIDLSVTNDEWNLEPPAERPLAGATAAKESLQSSERPTFDLSVAPDLSADHSATSDARSQSGVATFETSVSSDREIASFDVDGSEDAELGPAPHVEASDPTIDLLDLPSPTEEDLADLLREPEAIIGSEERSPSDQIASPDGGTSFDTWTPRQGDVALGIGASVDEADAASGAATSAASGEPSWEDLLGPESAPLDSDGASAEPVTGAALEVTRAAEGELGTDAFSRGHDEAQEAGRAQGELRATSIDAIDTDRDVPGGGPLARLEQALAFGRFDPAWRDLQVTVRETPSLSTEALDLLARYDGGSRVIRLQVTGDALMAAGRYWEALAKYAEALDAVRAPSGAR